MRNFKNRFKSLDRETFAEAFTKIFNEMGFTYRPIFVGKTFHTTRNIIQTDVKFSAAVKHEP